MNAEEWILSKCSKAGGPVDVAFSKHDLPAGVSVELLKHTFARMKRDRIIGGNIFAVADNTAHSLLGLKRL